VPALLRRRASPPPAGRLVAPLPCLQQGDAPLPAAGSFTNSRSLLACQRLTCTARGAGLWSTAPVSSAPCYHAAGWRCAPQARTAELGYASGSSSSSGFTLWHNGAQLATLAIPAGGASVMWPRLLWPFRNPCGCCNLCHAQSVNAVSGGACCCLPLPTCRRLLPLPAAAFRRCTSQYCAAQSALGQESLPESSLPASLPARLPTLCPAPAPARPPCSPALTTAQQDAQSGVSGRQTAPAASS
jgi:hypothetical protein